MKKKRKSAPKRAPAPAVSGVAHGDPLADAFPGVTGMLPRSLIAASNELERRGLIHGPRPLLRKALAKEIVAARAALAEDDLDGATNHAGRVHVLGSFYTITHAYSHFVHLSVDVRRGDWPAAAIQAVRLVGTAFTRPIVPFFGVTGHPGTSDRAAGTYWPIEPRLQKLLDAQPRPGRPFARGT